ncbi:MAG: PIG-L family deacetylase [Acidimicrobiales bacterium]
MAPTLMAVHAHPDDEVLFTGGALARYGAEGVRTVVVTCTGGELGYGRDGVAGRTAAADQAEVAAARRRELEASCRLLGVHELALLGYRDSGMAGWPSNRAAGAFAAAPLEEAAARLAELLERHRPQVVVTYGADGFYGHPDHVQAHRATVAALDRTGVADKTYFVAVPRSHLATAAELAAAADLTLPDWLASPAFGTDDRLVTTTLDCRSVAGVKFDALAAHATQLDNAFLLALGPDLFAEALGIEWYVRGADRSGAPVPEDDLFAGLR